MRPIPHQPTETDTREERERPTTRDERPETSEDEAWLAAQEF